MRCPSVRGKCDSLLFPYRVDLFALLRKGSVVAPYAADTRPDAPPKACLDYGSERCMGQQEHPWQEFFLPDRLPKTKNSRRIIAKIVMPTITATSIICSSVFISFYPKRNLSLSGFCSIRSFELICFYPNPSSNPHW